MLKRVADNFRNGIARIKWFSSVISARLKIEIAIVKLLHRSDLVQKQRDELIRTIGERIYEMRANEDRNVFRDGTIRESLGRIEDLEKEIEDLKRRVQDVSRVGI
jgi:seryl-tRNA synthetase